MTNDRGSLTLSRMRRARDSGRRSTVARIALVLALAFVGLVGVAAAGGPAHRPVGSGFLAFVTAKEVLVAGAYEERGTIWTADLDGSDRCRLVAGNDPEISPDGRRVAYLDHRNRVRVVSRDGGPSATVSAATRDYPAFAWAPDSRRIAIASGRTLSVVDLDSGRRVTIDRGALVWGFSFSPSGREIVWARKAGKPAIKTGGVDIYRAPSNGGRSRRLTHDRGSDTPVWGRRGIAFARFDPYAMLHPPVDLWFMQPDGRGARRISKQDLAPFAWSRDGRRLLTFAVSEVDTHPYAVNPATGRARPLARRGAEVFTAAFSRAGDVVLVTDNGRLLEIPWEGRGTRILARGVDEVADWTR